VNLRHHAALLVLAGATILALASCGKSTSVTSAAPAVDNAPLAAPADINSTYYPAASADILNWGASTSPSVTAIQVFEASADPSTGAPLTRIAQLPASATSLTLPPVSTACTKYYELRSMDSAGDYSAFSSPIAVVRHADSSSDSGNGGSNVNTGGGATRKLPSL